MRSSAGRKEAGILGKRGGRGNIIYRSIVSRTLSFATVSAPFLVKRTDPRNVRLMMKCPESGGEIGERRREKESRWLMRPRRTNLWKF